MNQTIINLKQRIDKNYKKLKRKYVLVKPFLKMLNELIDTQASESQINSWLIKHNNVIFSIEYNLIQRIEENQKELHERYGNNCELLEPTLNMLNLLLSSEAPDETIKLFLKRLHSSITIIEEKIEGVSRYKS